MTAWDLRPRSAAELVDASIQLLRQHARPLLLLATVLVIPGMLLGIANTLLFGDSMADAARGGSPGRTLAAFAPMIPLLLVLTSWYFVAFGALVSAAASGYASGVVPEPAEALRLVRARAGVLIGSGWLTYVLVLVQFVGVAIALTFVLGIVFFLVAMIGRAGSAMGSAAGGVMGILLGFAFAVTFVAGLMWLASRYATVPAVATIEALGVRATMRRARDLSRGSVARVAVLLGIVAVLFLVVTLGTLAILSGLLHSQAAASTLAGVFNIPLYAFGGALVAVLYYDLRVRHEGLDIELLAEEIGGGLEPVAAEALGH